MLKSDSNKTKELLFSIDNFEDFLQKIKSYCISMNIALDRHMISEQITDIFNTTLLGDVKDEKEIFRQMIAKYDIIASNLPSIIEKIEKFNQKEKNFYYIDIEKVFYIKFFKEIEYVLNILSELAKYVSHKINIVIVFTYIINSFYDEPSIISYYYIFILQELIISDYFKSKYNEIVQKIINPENAEILKIIIKVIFKADVSLQRLYADWHNDKIIVKQSLNGIDYKVEEENNNENIKPSQPNEIIAPNIEHKDETRQIAGDGSLKSNSDASVDSSKKPHPKFINIDELNKYYKNKKRELLDSKLKREFDFKDFYTKDLLEIINFKSEITKEIWNGFNLFIVNRFSVNYDDYKNSLSNYLKENNLDNSYNIELDELMDLKIKQTTFVKENDETFHIFTGRENQQHKYEQIAQKGGRETENDNDNDKYFKKYLKYKQKYIELKNF